MFVLKYTNFKAKKGIFGISWSKDSRKPEGLKLTNVWLVRACKAVAEEGGLLVGFKTGSKTGWENSIRDSGRCVQIFESSVAVLGRLLLT